MSVESTSKNEESVSDIDPRAALPIITTSLSADEVLGALNKASRRGRLPGFEKRDEGSFVVAAFGDPFDRELVSAIEAGDEGGARVRFRSRLLWKLPGIFIVLVVVSVWPGLPLTDALIPASWGWWPTWWWYLPLVVVPLPFVLPRMWKKSERAARKSAREAIEKIAREVDGAIEPVGA